MKPAPKILVLSLMIAAPVAGVSTGAVAQDAIVACSTQQALEQSLSSDGAITPNECQPISVESLVSDTNRLCLIDFGSGDSGFLDQMRDVAFSTEWWVDCEALAAAAQ